MITMPFGNLFTRHDKTAGVVKATTVAREKVELAADKLTAALDKIDGRAEITIRAFMDDTKAERRD